MDVNQFVAKARAVKDSLALLLDQDPATIAAQASSPVGLALSYQLGSVACLLDTLPLKLQQREPSLASAVAVDAHTSTTEVAAASGASDTEPQAPVVSGPSYRLIHRSGNPPPVNQGPARRRLSRDVLANVFGHLQPWELTRYRRPLGTPLFHQSAANYTKLVIDCEDDTARQMWETMPLAVAHRWGKRATNVREIKHRHPEWRGEWCRGTWVALVEGHGSGRAVIADKKRREREGGEGTADAAAMRDGDDPRSADEGTLEVLPFEEVKLDKSVDIIDPRPSYRLPPAPAGPIHLPALKTVDNISSECLYARVGRQWRTPAVKTLTIRGDLHESEVEGARAWLGDCEAIEVLDADEVAGVPASVLSALPADGKSLAALRTLRGIRLLVGTPAEIDRLREVLVARGVRRSIRELKIVWNTLSNTDEDWERLQKTAQLVDAVAHPEALSGRVVRKSWGCGHIDAEFLSRTSSAGSPTMQRIVDEFAKTADTVKYKGGDEPVPAAITDDTFPAAHTLQLLGGALADDAKEERAIEIASHMPSLARIDVGDAIYGAHLDAPADEVWVFLERLQTALVSREREKSLSVGLGLPASAFLEPLSDQESPCLWGRDSNDKLPPIKDVAINVFDDVADAGDLETFYQHAMASVASFSNELKGHKRTGVYFHESTDLCQDFERRFVAEQGGLNFAGGPYKFSFVDDTFSAPHLLVERRT
ncbi:unnamed protein product [Vitrella brassicaformis CCMP3155]|uniref:Uncharacterized protein n=1 Tax=Vitrella brassicaformis (strain CCMP3155) TaxID=1169540 RepID=A0A0G4GE44_VITBC|nr:unnamed protein product [Vitrella brassicaformis CCMP3155]|eukprot:CEM27696.1 unnamed protein product [Vitrella brassicaformis CCMP3155]